MHLNFNTEHDVDFTCTLRLLSYTGIYNWMAVVNWLNKGDFKLETDMESKIDLLYMMVFLKKNLGKGTSG